MILKFKKGFSLVELLVVIAIIGILAAVGITAYQGYTTGAKEKAVLANQKQIVTLINAEFAKCAGGSGNYPWGKYKTGTTSGGDLEWDSNPLDDCDRNATTAEKNPSDYKPGQVSAEAIVNYINYHLELKNPWDNTDTEVGTLLKWPDSDEDKIAAVGKILIICGAAHCTVQSTINKTPTLSTEVTIVYY